MRYWTAAGMRLLERQSEAGMSSAQIAAIHDRTVGAVRAKVSSLGLTTGRHPNREVTLMQICARVAEQHGMTVEQLRGPSRIHAISAARQQDFAESWDSGRSYPVIGRFYNRDHSTVIFGVRRHRGRIG